VCARRGGVTGPGGRVGFMVRAKDMTAFVNAPWRAELKAKMEIPRGNVAEKGCADASLYQRFREAGMASVKIFPQLVTFGLDEPHGQRLEAGILATLSDAETKEWRAATSSVPGRELGFISKPFHFAVWEKP